MGSVRQAVLEFDAAVRVPWRPLLREEVQGAAGAGGRQPRRTAAVGPSPVGARSGTPGSGGPVSGGYGFGGYGFGGCGSGGARSRVPAAGLPGSGPRVTGHLRPVPDRPVDRAPRTTGPAAAAPRTRRDPVRPGGRPPQSAPARGLARGRCTPPPVRLTRRGRCLVAVLVLASGIAGAVVGREVLAPDPGLRLAGESSVVVEQGDTVWSIADRVTGPDEDVRAVVDAIVVLNDLEGSVVVPGQVLQVP